jgi:hypothetical protein
VIDFQYMRQRVGVGPTGDILDIISSWPAEEQQRAHQAIQEIEEQALRDMQVRPAACLTCNDVEWGFGDLKWLHAAAVLVASGRVYSTGSSMQSIDAITPGA